MDDLARIQFLRKELHRHCYRYYVCNAATITDEEYDRLFRELIDLERRFPECEDPNSPTRRVGAPSVSGFKKVRHERPMLSLDNAFTPEEVLQRLGSGNRLALEPKVDGLSLKLIYRGGRLMQAITRGDGQEGDDVTANAKTIKTIPLRLNAPKDIEVTGEVYMSYDVFNALNEALDQDGEELFANPRNAASGSFKSKDPAEVAARQLSFVAHGALTEFADIATQLDLISFLGVLGFQTVWTLPYDAAQDLVGAVECSSPEELAAEIARANRLRMALGLATDGLVFKIDDLARQRELGEGSRSPNWAIAYKFPPERKPTTLVDVTLQIGRTGKVTPVAELKPVRLSGTVVRRASLCNQDEIQRLRVAVGDTVYVEKSAEIIPKVVGVAHAGGVYINGVWSTEMSGGSPAPSAASFEQKPVFKFQATCPCCGAALVRPEALVDFYCVNPDCEDQVCQRLIHATGKQALNIDGCGKVMAKALVQQGVRKLSDLFALTDLSFVKPAARAKLKAGLVQARNAALWRKYHALSIEGIGRSLCQEIAARWPSLNEALDDLDVLKSVLGPVNFAAFTDYCVEQAVELERLEGLGFKLEADAAKLGPLSGRVFCITGALASGSRDAVIRIIEQAGGVVKGSVTSKVHYLVQGMDGGATKAAAARKHSVAVIPEETLYEMIGIPMPMRQDTTDPNQEY